MLSFSIPILDGDPERVIVRSFKVNRKPHLLSLQVHALLRSPLMWPERDLHVTFERCVGSEPPFQIPCLPVGEGGESLLEK